MLQHGEEEMLDGCILVSHRLRLVRRCEQDLVQVTADIRLTALDLDAGLERAVQRVLELTLVDSHFLEEL